jgi:hypothetical protein
MENSAISHNGAEKQERKGPGREKMESESTAGNQLPRIGINQQPN